VETAIEVETAIDDRRGTRAMWIPVVFVVWLQIPVDVHDRLDGIERVHACMHGPTQCDPVDSLRN
jgi:hypothetical protein